MTCEVLVSAGRVKMAARQQKLRIRRPRNFRPRRDIFNSYDDAELKKRYRLDRAGIVYVTDLVRDAITNVSERSNAVTAEMKVVLTLRYLATGKMQQDNADDLGLSQPTISRVITKTLDALTTPNIIQRFIRFPTDPREIQRNQAEFAQIAGFPGIVGVVDCTHVRLVAPKEYEESYVNRKNYHSVNVQVVFDAKYKILDVVSKWPGSTHDSRILRESGLWQGFEQNQIPPCYLLGDSGYPSKRWLLTPYQRPQGGHQVAYNRAHKATRCVVERGIDQLKRRFRVLHGEIRVSPQKTAKIIMACGILHNICKLRNIQLYDQEDVEENGNDSDDDDDVFQPAADVPVQDGGHFRDYIANTHFMIED